MDIRVTSTTEGDFWGIWTAGHHDKSEFLEAVHATPEAAKELAEIEEQANTKITTADIEHSFIHPCRDEDSNAIYFDWCGPADKDAMPITAYSADQ